MSVIDRLSDSEKQELAMLAIKASRDLGYCDESIHVLERMGLSSGEKEVRITLTANVMLPFHVDPHELDIEVLRLQDETYEPYEAEVYDIKVEL